MLRSVARGLFIVDIAEELFPSGSAIKTHGGDVLAKPEIRDRVEPISMNAYPRTKSDTATV